MVVVFSVRFISTFYRITELNITDFSFSFRSTYTPFRNPEVQWTPGFTLENTSTNVEVLMTSINPSIQNEDYYTKMLEPCLNYFFIWHTLTGSCVDLCHCAQSILSVVIFQCLKHNMSLPCVISFPTAENIPTDFFSILPKHNPQLF